VKIKSSYILAWFSWLLFFTMVVTLFFGLVRFTWEIHLLLWSDLLIAFMVSSTINQNNKEQRIARFPDGVGFCECTDPLFYVADGDSLFNGRCSGCSKMPADIGDLVKAGTAEFMGQTMILYKKDHDPKIQKIKSKQ